MKKWLDDNYTVHLTIFLSPRIERNYKLKTRKDVTKIKWSEMD